MIPRGARLVEPEQAGWIGDDPTKGMTVSDIFCPNCRLQQPTSHTYCARCGAALPLELVGERRKSARFFAGVKILEEDPEQGFLRVSHYRATERLHGGDAAIDVPNEHVRFSVWVEDRAQCVISLPVSEARELAVFLNSELRRSPDTLTAERI
jgi:hypothetical protein